jgi:ketosteroid isomerase-like protein
MLSSAPRRAPTREEAMGGRLFITFAAALLLAGCFKQQTLDKSDKSALEIRQLLDRWTTAFEAKNLDGVMAYYAPGDRLDSYDVTPPLEYKGAAAYRKDYADFFKLFKGPLHIDERGVDIEADNNVAFAHGLERLTGTMTDGTPVAMWLRWTSGYRKINGRWYALHDHVSVPVDLASGKALTNLKP